MSSTIERKSVAILTEIISPYRIPVFNELSADPRIDLEVLFFSKTERRRSWRIPFEKIYFRYRVLQGILVSQRYQGGPIFLNPTIMYDIWRGKYHSIICFGYHHPTIWLALIACKMSRTRVLLWSESTGMDHRAPNKIVEYIKRYLVSKFDGFVAAGRSQVDYLESIGAKDNRIWVAPDSVDSDFFVEKTKEYRDRKDEIKLELGIFGPVILYVGRMLDDKGIPELIEAFQKVIVVEDAMMLLVGDGPDLERYQEVCNRKSLTSVIRFEGFCSQEVLPKYYAIADFLVFPTRSDPWGLVLNEAMCAGLPVICSVAAGASAELVRPGRNGLVHQPGNVEEIRDHMLALLKDSTKRTKMGLASQQAIEAFHPTKMAQGFAEAVFDLPNDAYNLKHAN
ncbi:MAG: hypothetical protein CL606_00795 [Anaerolineaceae bacterium]|nr:hypothetical protein [Anaerolineaceae bacterium]|tara:strand:- start:962 stop:2146 length:1185 start_codon:yes stop_codon:yes gene_type:complete